MARAWGPRYPPRPVARLPALSERSVGALTALLTLLGWGSVPLFLKHFSHSIDAWTSNGWRYGFAALLWAPVLVSGALRRRLPPSLWRAALLPAGFNIAGQVAFTTAHYRLDPALVVFGLRLQIVFVALGAALLFPAERALLRVPGVAAGLIVVFGGTAATLLQGGAPVGATGTGVALAVGSGLAFAGYALSVRAKMQGFHPLTAFAAISLYTALAMVALMFAFGAARGAGPLHLPDGQLGLLLLSSVIGVALGHVLYYISIARLGVAVTAGVIQLQPVLVGVGAALLFGDHLSLGQWCSGLLAVAGAALLLASQARAGARLRTRPDAPRSG